MALTVTEASAVFDLLHWLCWQPAWSRHIVDDDKAAEVGQLGLLAQREHTPILAVHVADIYTLVDHPPAQTEATA